ARRRSPSAHRRFRRWGAEIPEVATTRNRTQVVRGAADAREGDRIHDHACRPCPGSTDHEEDSMSDDTLQRWVDDELFWEPAIDSKEVAAAVHDGAVTLRGTVGSFREKRVAAEAVHRVDGVTSVRNELDIHDLRGFARDDAEVRGAVLQAM